MQKDVQIYLWSFVEQLELSVDPLSPTNERKADQLITAVI